MSRKKIGLLAVGALRHRRRGDVGRDRPSTTAANEPSTSPAPSSVDRAGFRQPIAGPCSASPSVTPPAAALTGTVTEVVDGDTIRVDLPSGLETVRIIGIDTPEVVHPTQPEACYGAEASAFAKETLDGKTVTLEVDPTQDERDRYDRLLAHVYVGDTLYTEAAIAGGYGIHYIYERPSSHADELDAAAATAKAEKHGIWAHCDGRVDLPATISTPAPDVTPAATTKPNPEPTQDAACHPSYEPCVPDTGHDLDCSDIGFRVRVIGRDEYRLDGNKDGWGCERS